MVKRQLLIGGIRSLMICAVCLTSGELNAYYFGSSFDILGNKSRGNGDRVSLLQMA